MTERRRRAGLIGVSALALFLIGGVSAAVELRSHDFVALYGAASLVVRGDGPAVLDPEAVLAAERAAEPTRTVLLPYVHPPAVALLLSPLALLPIAVAVLVMTAVNVLCIVWSCLRFAIVAAPAQGHRLFALGLFAPPATIALTQGQTSPLVLALLAGAMSSSGVLRGVLLGLTAIRPQTFPLVALCAWTSRREVAGLAIGAGAVVAASAAVAGPPGLVEYARVLVTAGSWSLDGAQGVASAIGWTGPALALGVAPLGLVLTLASLVAGAIVVVRSSRPDRLPQAGLWSLLASPHVLLHDALLAYPAIAAAARSTRAVAVIAGSGIVVALVHQAGVPIAPFWLLALAVVLARGETMDQ